MEMTSSRVLCCWPGELHYTTGCHICFGLVVFAMCGEYAVSVQCSHHTIDGSYRSHTQPWFDKSNGNDNGKRLLMPPYQWRLRCAPDLALASICMSRLTIASNLASCIPHDLRAESLLFVVKSGDRGASSCLTKKDP